MTAANGLEALSSGVILSPFTQLRRLLEGIAPGHEKPIELTVGEPREEMPGFVRLQDRWKGRGVQFVGLSDDDPSKVERFAAELKINYPLWVGVDTAGELSHRLGNRLRVLPHTVILDPAGNRVEMRVGPYTERDLESKLVVLVAK